VTERSTSVTGSRGLRCGQVLEQPQQVIAAQLGDAQADKLGELPDLPPLGLIAYVIVVHDAIPEAGPA